MKKLLEFLVKSIVEHPSKIKVTSREQDNFITLIVQSHPEDIKLIIGKKGRTIKALRELTKIKAVGEKKRIEIEVHPQPI